MFKNMLTHDIHVLINFITISCCVKRRQSVNSGMLKYHVYDARKETLSPPGLLSRITCCPFTVQIKCFLRCTHLMHSCKAVEIN